MSEGTEQPVPLGEGSNSLAKCTIQEPEETSPRYQIIDERGNYDPTDIPDLTEEELLDLFRWMLCQEIIDDRMVKLQRRGEMGTYASGRGQEASIVGGSYALKEQDWLFPYGREAAALLIQGMPIRDLMLYWRGVEDANMQKANRVFPPAIAIGTHIPVGVGYAWGLKMSDEDAIAALFHGDGHPSTGEYQSGANFASSIEAPALFYCQNNGYSISVDFDKQTGADTIAQKGMAWGMDGIRVDGNDVLAIYDAVTTAREHVKEGNPTIVESVTYRLDAHTTNDDPSLYRENDEVDWWEEREPIGRFRSFLESEGVLEEGKEEEMRAEINEEFDEAKEAADDYDPGGIEEMFRHLYDELPPELERQLAEYEDLFEKRPDMHDYIEHRPKG
jgi:pyruvate dehydrogenase E1 component alpha subunit